MNVVLGIIKRAINAASLTKEKKNFVYRNVPVSEVSWIDPTQIVRSKNSCCKDGELLGKPQ